MHELSPALTRAQEIVDQLYQLTADLNYNGEINENDETDDAEVTAYAAMTEAREPLIKELETLRETLTPTDRATPEMGEIIKCITEIIEMDKDHAAYFKQLQDEVRDSIKEIKKGRQISNAYNMDAQYQGASYIDRKN